MRKFNVVSRYDDESKKIEKDLIKKLTKREMELSNEPEIVIAIGGDGTMLEAFKSYGADVNYLGIHTGTLGFYADWEKEEVDLLIENIVNAKDPCIVEYPLVEVTIKQRETEEIKKYLAMNEMIIKSGNLSTFIMDVEINDGKFETFRGDGMIISTPTGSTAYNYSVQGSVLHPSLEVIQVAELAAINNSVYRTLNRSFVLPKHHELKLNIYNVNKNVLIGIDGIEIKEKDIESVLCTVSDEKIKFIRYKNYPFWQRVKEKFL